MNKKFIGITLLTIMFLSIVGCNKNQVNDTASSDSIDKKSVNPISKSTVINILKAEYGDNILVEEKDIKLIGDLYFVDVYVEIEEDDENNETHTHTHKQSLGTKKIDKYTGEIIN